MSKISDLVAKDIKKTMAANDINISPEVARVAARETLDLIALILRDKAEQMSRSMSGMQDAAAIETVIGMLES